MADITEYTEQQIREFYVRGKNEFYRISICEQEETDDTNYIFADGAISEAKQLHKPFVIRKVKFVYEGKKSGDDVAEVQSSLYFDADGIVYGYSNTESGVTKSENELRECLDELIPSKDVRDYMVKRGCVLNDFEKATLIYNHSEMSFTEKAARLKDLMEQTENEILKEEIQDRLSYDELCLSRFYENDGDHIYELQVYDPEDETSYEQGYYKSGAVAVGCGKKFQENFSVHKILILTEEKEPIECRSDYSSTVYFDNQGQVRGYYSSEIEWTAKKSEMDFSRFENAFVKIPHPFSNGDFVRIKNNDRVENEICIVECYNSDFGEEREKTCYYDFSDASLRVAYIYGAARFGHEHVKIVDVEFTKPKEDDPKYELLCCAQSLVQGHGGLNDLQFLCDEYNCRRKNQKNREE